MTNVSLLRLSLLIIQLRLIILQKTKAASGAVTTSFDVLLQSIGQGTLHLAQLCDAAALPRSN